MWVRHNRHFGIAKYSQLLSIHFEEAKQYLESINVVEKVESDPYNGLKIFLDRVSSRYPALENPLAYEIAQQVGEKLKYQSPNGPKTSGFQFRKVVLLQYINTLHIIHL